MFLEPAELAVPGVGCNEVFNQFLNYELNRTKKVLTYVKLLRSYLTFATVFKLHSSGSRHQVG